MIAKDKILHLVMGVLAVAVTYAAVWIGQYNLGLSLAFVSTIFGAFYEWQQWYRKEGQPDLLDAIATAAPGWLAWALIEVVA
jgi:hypothetical protein